MKFEPVIKWSGSKRSQADEIIKYFPSEINTYYEPFCGGASVMFRLMESGIKCRKYVASDINKDLIYLFREIRDNPDKVYEHYRRLWNELNADDDISRKREYYNNIRKRLNEEHNPLDFMFIMRTAFNGMPRYNSKGQFNTPFHIGRNGIVPERLKKIIDRWNCLLTENDVKFLCCNYSDIKPETSDFMYLNPPYDNTRGMYYGGLENTRLFSYLENLKCGWIMSYDGKSGEKDNTYDVPVKIYDEHVYIKSGNSSFKRIICSDRSAMVYESLYIKK